METKEIQKQPYVTHKGNWIIDKENDDVYIECYVTKDKGRFLSLRGTARALNLKGAGSTKIGNINIPCYVTDEGQRLLASRRLQVILKITEETTSSGRQVPGKRMDRFFGQKSLKPLLNRIFDRTLLEPIKVKRKGKVIVGYDAKLLPGICRTMLEGRREDLLVGTRQLIIAEQCEILQSGFRCRYQISHRGWSSAKCSKSRRFTS